MPAHIHAELMKQYAEDAAKTDRPFELWESKQQGTVKWLQCVSTPRWHPACQYRRKPEPKPDTVNFINVFSTGSLGSMYSCKKTAEAYITPHVLRTYGKVATLQLTFDGNTQELKDIAIVAKYEYRP